MTTAIDRNAVAVTGQGTIPMVFVHGFGCDRTMWRHLAKEFSKTHKVVLYDLTGSGASDLTQYDLDKYSSLQGHADDLVEIMNELGLKDAILVGHSVSSMIVTLVANQIPDKVDRVVMIGPSPRYINDTDYPGGFAIEDLDELLGTLDANFLGWSSQMAPAIMGVPECPDLGEELKNSFCRTDPDIASHFANTVFRSDHREDAKALDHPALLLQCSQDIIADIPVGLWMRDNMKDAHFVQLEATGHCPHVSAPTETIAAMMPFVDQVPAA